MRRAALVCIVGLVAAGSAGWASAKRCTATGCAATRGAYVNDDDEGTLVVRRGGVELGNALVFGRCESPQLGSTRVPVRMPVGRLFRGSAPRIGHRKTYELAYTSTTAAYRDTLAVTFSRASTARYRLSIRNHTENHGVVQDCRATLREPALKGPVRG